MFRIYLNASISTTETIGYSNDVEIFNYNTLDKLIALNIVSISIKINTVPEEGTDPKYNFMTLELPAHVIKKSYSTDIGDLPTTTQYLQRYQGILRFLKLANSDYLLFFINDMSYAHLDRWSHSLLTKMGATKIDTNQPVSWIMLIQNTDGQLTVIDEKLGESPLDTLIIYHLSNSEFLNQDIDRWNALFKDDFAEATITSYFETMFADLSAVITNIETILQKYRDLDYYDLYYSGTLIDSNQLPVPPVPEYISTPENMESDIESLKTMLSVVKTITKVSGVINIYNLADLAKRSLSKETLEELVQQYGLTQTLYQKKLNF